MPTAHGAHIKYAWQLQADAILAQAAPVQNTWYTVLAATEDVRLIGIIMMVADTGETLQLRTTIDGLPDTTSQAAVANTVYSIASNLGFAEDDIGVVANTIITYRPFIFEGQSVKVEIRKTTANGAGILNCRVKYARLLPT